MDSEVNRKFGKLFKDKYCLTLLENILNFLNSDMRSRMPKRLLTGCINYVSTGYAHHFNSYKEHYRYATSPILHSLSFVSTYHATTWKVIKPHLSALVQHIFFPILAFTEADNELFEDDPQSYMKHEFGMPYSLLHYC